MREWRGDADWEGESAKRFESFWETLSFRACIAMIRDRRLLSEMMDGVSRCGENCRWCGERKGEEEKRVRQRENLTRMSLGDDSSKKKKKKEKTRVKH